MLLGTAIAVWWRSRDEPVRSERPIPVRTGCPSQAGQWMGMGVELPVRPDAAEPLCFETLFFGCRHLRRFSINELDAAGRATRIAAARMKDVDLGVLLNREDQSLPVRHWRSTDLVID